MTQERAKSLFRELQALARADYGGNTGALLVVYAVEGFLRLLAASTYASKMTLKGGMLLAALSARRMTRDADFATVGLDNNERAVAAVVREIVVTVLEVADMPDRQASYTAIGRPDGLPSGRYRTCGPS